MCIGIHGQSIYIDRSKQLVCVKLSSHPTRRPACTVLLIERCALAADLNDAPDMTSAEVIVIGGGIIGCSIAYHLTQLGVSDVIVLERKTDVWNDGMPQVWSRSCVPRKT